jgi:hypothetical protein
VASVSKPIHGAMLSLIPNTLHHDWNQNGDTSDRQNA